MGPLGSGLSTNVQKTHDVSVMAGTLREATTVRDVWTLAAGSRASAETDATHFNRAFGETVIQCM